MNRTGRRSKTKITVDAVIDNLVFFIIKVEKLTAKYSP